LAGFSGPSRGNPDRLLADWGQRERTVTAALAALREEWTTNFPAGLNLNPTDLAVLDSERPEP
jgi:hypothetical protein